MVQAKTQTTEANNAKDATQSELDDLLMVFGDLEDKVNKYKVWAAKPTILLISTILTAEYLGAAPRIRGDSIRC